MDHPVLNSGATTLLNGRDPHLSILALSSDRPHAVTTGLCTVLKFLFSTSDHDYAEYRLVVMKVAFNLTLDP
jgi:hypothetical protein